MIIPERQLPHEQGTPLTGALRVVGISCREVLRRGGEPLRAGVPGASSCGEPPEGLAPFLAARSSQLVRNRFFLQPFSSRDSARSSLGLGGGGGSRLKGLPLACGSSLLTCAGVSRGSAGLFSGPQWWSAARDPGRAARSSSVFGSCPLSILPSGCRCRWAASECPRLVNLDGIVQGPALTPGSSLAEPGDGPSWGCRRRPVSGMHGQPSLGEVRRRERAAAPPRAGVVQLLHGWEP